MPLRHVMPLLPRPTRRQDTIDNPGERVGTRAVPRTPASWLLSADRGKNPSLKRRVSLGAPEQNYDSSAGAYSLIEGETETYRAT